MLGNDVIDLADIDARPDTFSARFDERVFAAEERRAIAHDDLPLACRWAHWGAKEAAYKLLRQIDQRFVFSPRTLIARFEPVPVIVGSGARSGTRILRRGRLELPAGIGLAAGPEAVSPDAAIRSISPTAVAAAPRTDLHSLASTRVRELEIRSLSTPDYVHVLALPCGSDWDAIDAGIEACPTAANGRADASRAVRSFAIREISRSLGVDAARLSIGQRGKIPTVELDGARTSLSLSLSHHGRWIGYAMTPRIDVTREMVWTGEVIEMVDRRAPAESSR